MHSAFDVAFANVKLAGLPPSRREAKVEAAPERVRAGWQCLLAGLGATVAVASVWGRLPYAGTIVHVLVLELAPLLAVGLEHRSARLYVALLACGAGLGLFALQADPLRQELLALPLALRVPISHRTEADVAQAHACIPFRACTGACSPQEPCCT